MSTLLGWYRANPEWRQPSVIIIPKRTKIRVPLLRKNKVVLPKKRIGETPFLCISISAPRNGNVNRLWELHIVFRFLGLGVVMLSCCHIVIKTLWLCVRIDNVLVKKQLFIDMAVMAFYKILMTR